MSCNCPEYVEYYKDTICNCDGCEVDMIGDDRLSALICRKCKCLKCDL